MTLAEFEHEHVVRITGPSKSSSCVGKRCYRHYTEANTAAARMNIKTGGEPIHAYRCWHCPWWHIGHQYQTKGKL